MPHRTLRVKHGSLELNIPYSVFVKGTSGLNDSSDEYFSMLRQRYPWLSNNSIVVLKRRTEEEMQRTIEEGLRGAVKARMLSKEGKDMEAIHHLESYLVDFPEDSDAWYALGEILCKIGRDDDGYRAISHGRRFF
jgi:tetratricopeptide (TPR) repeat protein